MTIRRIDKEIHILKEIAELLNEGTDIIPVLQEVLKKLLDVTGLKVGWVFLIEDNGMHRLAAHQSLPPALANEQDRIMCQGNCWCVDRYNRKTLTKATNIIECARIEEAIENNIGSHLGITHHATVPLRAGDERFGLLNVGSPHKTHFEASELDLLESVAYQIGTALKRITLTQREQEHALLAERNRLARDLHDSVNQLLFSLSLTARAGKELSEEKQVNQTFSHIQKLAQEALGEMRALIWQLRPRGLECGLISTLTGYAELLGLTMNTTVTGITSLPGKIEEALLRIGQEALSNCKKHAQVNHVEVNLHTTSRLVTLTITDNGCGFSYSKDFNLPSLGLRTMRERTEDLQGQFSVKSLQGKGTSINIKIPL
ncbi:two-component system, NarL family, sensor kinase [Bacillus sp. OV322]|uniref:GAF domain-containing sensor histidine kinase n=1 Tax=Bacillus sp. OV322 TaxID=1882764 RepID=UPI0008E78A9C|nr:GAF domain-containing sensor histidine kinase [Bacillus sp. OV322]SFC17521.1 two-component system, NarL family, sensor kinase [Bacillus sp. OV322]